MHSIYLVDYRLAGDFFLRIASADPECRHHIVTSIRSASVEKPEKLITSTLISRFSKKINCPYVDLSKTREVLLGTLTEKDALDFYRAIRYAVEVYLSSEAISASSVTLHVWNGSSVMGAVARSLKREFGVKTLFFEISNLPGKIFVDPDGTNAQSRLFCKPSLLDEFPSCFNDYVAWRTKFIERKRQGTLVPQAATARKLKIHHIGDFLFGLFVGYKGFSWDSVRTKLSSLFKISGRGRSQSLSTDEDGLPARYIFFPMQVSNDTQIVLNSHIDNLGALNLLAKDSDAPIVIKPHPAEFDISYIFSAIESSSFKFPPVLTNANTLRLIEKAEKVVTINSTTGLESLIMGKKTQFLAKSFYAHFDEKRLASYVMRYLINLDFFSAANAPVSEGVITELRRRACM